MMTKTHTLAKNAVYWVRKSAAQTCAAWLLMKVRHVCLGYHGGGQVPAGEDVRDFRGLRHQASGTVSWSAGERRGIRDAGCKEP